MKSSSEKEEEFNRLKDVGFSLASQKKYAEAKLKLQEALTLKNDAGVLSKIAEINGLQKELDSQAALDQKYDGLITEAASFEAQSKYAEAILKYKNALKLKPSEKLPKDKVAELEQRVSSDAAQVEIDKKYEVLMNRGDVFLAQEKYIEAIEEYNAALDLKPNEQEPVDKANEAERLEKAKNSEGNAQYDKILTVAEKKIAEGNFEKATELINRAIGLRPSDPRPKKLLTRINQIKTLNAEYDVLMTKADGLAKNKKYVDAKRLYEEASRKKTGESLPKEKIEEMKRLIAEVSSSAQKDKLYKDYMDKGRKNQASKSYVVALSEYQNALSVKPGDVPAQDKINEIQQLLDDEANANVTNLEKKNRFDQIIKEADVLFTQETYLDAKNKYETALDIDPKSNYVKKQIEECIRLEREKGNIEADREYNKLLAEADKEFDNEDYQKAKDSYSRALTFRSGEPYPKRKLKEIDAILNPVTIASAELEALGDPFDNSILDGVALLEKAEEQRKLIKGTKIQAEIDDIQTAESIRTNEKMQDHYDNSNEIYQVQRKISRDAGKSDLNRQATVEAIKKSELERTETEREIQRFEYAENIGDQGLLYAVSKEIEIDYAESEGVYLDNSDIMESYNRAQANAMNEKILLDRDANIKSDQELRQAKLAIDEGVRDDYDERALVRQQVVRAENYAVTEFLKKSDDRYNVQLSNKGEIDKIERAYDEKAIEDAKSVFENTENLKIVQKNVNETADARVDLKKDELLAANVQMNQIKADYDTKIIEGQEATASNNEELKGMITSIAESEKIRKEVEQNHNYKADREIEDAKALIQVEQEGFDENRKESTELLKESNKRVADANYDAYNKEMESRLIAKAKIDESVEANLEINELADKAHDQKVEYVNA
ncbi:MAG: hypothetical protein JKY09_08740, partial [Crocinitomicaceae bacterium]|nr:hypothetical protein [Crocinitomicaceae bacterium]